MAKIDLLSGQAIRTPTFRRLARIDSRESICKKIPIFEALRQICTNQVFSPIRIDIRAIRVQSSLLSIFWKVDSQKKGFSKRELIRANRPTKLICLAGVSHSDAKREDKIWLARC